VPVIVMYIKRQIASALGAVAEATAVSPFAGEGLDEAFGLAVGLRPVRAGEVMGEAQFVADGGKGVRAITDSVVGEDGADRHVVAREEGDGFSQRGNHVRDLFIRFDAGKAEAAVIVDGDVDGFDARALAAVGTIAGAAHARPDEATQFLDVEMEQFAGRGALIPLDGRFRFQVGQAVEVVAAQDPRDGRPRHASLHDDLRVGEAAIAQFDDAPLDGGRRAVGLPLGLAGVIVEPRAQPFFAGAAVPFAGGFLTDTAGGCCRPQCQSLVPDIVDHQGSTQRGEPGIRVHVVRVVELGVCNDSTRNLSVSYHADNLL